MIQNITIAHQLFKYPNLRRGRAASPGARVHNTEGILGRDSHRAYIVQWACTTSEEHLGNVKFRAVRKGAKRLSPLLKELRTKNVFVMRLPNTHRPYVSLLVFD